MPIVIPKTLPAYDVLEKENIFVMPNMRAAEQDIRPIEIAIVNLMPTKIETETQLMRLLGNSPLQTNVTLIKMNSHESKNTSREHLDKFYKTFDEVKGGKFDGMIITGAPVETLDFEDVNYWQELTSIMDYAQKSVTSTIYICWGAQAGLHYHYGIQKYMLDKKLFGIFPFRRELEHDPLLKGTDDNFYIPMSRHTGIVEEQVRQCDKLVVLASSKEAGISILKSCDNKQVFFFGHSEYDKDTLKGEYLRDLAKGIEIDRPMNYFADSSNDEVDVKWRSTANILFYNWINYYIYQVTPFDISKVNNDE